MDATAVTYWADDPEAYTASLVLSTINYRFTVPTEVIVELDTTSFSLTLEETSSADEFCFSATFTFRILGL